MKDYLNYFFNPNHLFSLRPGVMHNQAIVILVIIFGLFVAFAVFSKLTERKTKDGLKIKGWRRLWHLFLTIGIIGFLYLLCAWQGLVLLSARFWLLAIFLVALAWLGFIGKYMFIQAPKIRKSIEEKRKFEKYLP